MRNTRFKKTTDKIIIYLTIILLGVLFVLMASVIYSYGNSNLANSKVPFNFDMLTADMETDFPDVEKYMMPEFIGLTLDGYKYGISSSENIIFELYDLMAPAFSSLLNPDNRRSATTEYWYSLADSSNTVYLRYHNQLPDNVVGLFADFSSDESESENTVSRDTVSSYIYEMIYLPPDAESRMALIAVRSVDGNIGVYKGIVPEGTLDYGKIAETAGLYKSSFNAFEFSKDKYKSTTGTEPVFLTTVVTREILITNNSASLLQANAADTEKIIRLFSMNPDKLLNQHVDEYGNQSFIDVHGVLYMRDSGFEYQAANGGGISVDKIIGFSKKIGLREYILSSVKILSGVRDLNRYCIGGDANVFLDSVEAANGRVRLIFNYSFDNLRLVGGTPAFCAEFENGKLVSANLYSVAVKNLASRVQSHYEWWFYETVGKEYAPQNVCLVYESDYISESVSAKWAATVPVK